MPSYLELAYRGNYVGYCYAGPVTGRWDIFTYNGNTYLANVRMEKVFNY